jgi:hypothetical protein
MKKLILSLSVVAMMGVVSLPVFASNSVDQQETRKEDDKKCEKDGKKKCCASDTKKCDKDGKACDKDSKKCDKKEKKSCCAKGKKAE